MNYHMARNAQATAQKAIDRARHTAGPWTVGLKSEYGTHNPNQIYGIDDGADVGVCSVFGVPLHTTLEELQRSGNTSDASGLANARLIAAAPDLLAACRGVMKWVDCGCDPSPISLDVVRAAISKATQS